MVKSLAMSYIITFCVAVILFVCGSNVDDLDILRVLFNFCLCFMFINMAIALVLAVAILCDKRIRW